VEIRDWIRAIGARLALIGVVAIAAALLAATLALFQPQQYRATGTLALPGVPTSGPATAAVAQQMANFEGAVTSDGVLDAVAQVTGVPRDALNTVTVVRSGSSNILEVRFVGRDRDQARDVVVAAARQGLVLQANTDLAFAQADVTAANDGYEVALAAFLESAEANNAFFPDSKLNELNTDLIDAEADGSDARIASLEAEIQAVQETQRLKNAADGALTNLTVANDRLRVAQGRVIAAETLPVNVGEVVALSKLQSMVKQGAYAAVFGAALAVGFVIIVELLRSGTGSSRPSLPRPTRQRTRAGAF
jgi:hypothetical protein